MKKQISLCILFGLAVSGLLINKPSYSVPDFVAKLCSYVPVKTCVATGLGLFGAAAYCNYKMGILGGRLNEINAQIKHTPQKREYPVPNYAKIIQEIEAFNNDLKAFIRTQGLPKSHIAKLNAHFTKFAKLILKQDVACFNDSELHSAWHAASTVLSSIVNSKNAIKAHRDTAGGGRKSNYDVDKDIKNLAIQGNDLKTKSGPVFSEQLLLLVRSLKQNEKESRANKRTYETEYSAAVEKIREENEPFVLQRITCDQKINTYWNWLENFSKAGTAFMLFAAVSAYFKK